MSDSPATSIVITGEGLVTCLGLDIDATWRAVSAGACGIGSMSALEQQPEPDKGGGQASELPGDFAADQPREVRYLRWAIEQAVRDAGLHAARDEPLRVGVVLGTTLHGMRAAGAFLRSNNLADLQTFLAGATLARAIGDLPEHLHVAYAATNCSACSSALASVAIGCTLLDTDACDVVIAGGYDTVSEYVYAGFNSLRLVAADAQRPFAHDRDGMKVAEGYGVVVLERASDAAERGARPRTIVAGFGESADTHHLTQPHPEGDGAARAMREALGDAACSPGEVAVISAHATATPDNDAAEYTAMRSVFGDALAETPVVAFKSHVGHTLGGAGAVEMILTARGLREGVAPPVANVSRDDVQFEGLSLAHEARDLAAPRAALGVSLGFGGANAAIVLRPVDDKPAEHANRAAGATGRSDMPQSRDRRAVITGIGVVLPGAIGVEQLHAGAGNIGTRVDDASLVDLINARRARRISHYAKLLLAAATLAFRDAAIDDITAFGASCAAVVGTSHGASDYCERYYRQIVDEGINAANPMLFAEGVPNVGSAHLSLAFGLAGSCQSIIGTRTAGLDALRLAALRIATGRCDRAVVAAGEEATPLIEQAYAACPGAKRNAPLGEGAVVLILEAEDAATARGARAYGRYVDGVSAFGADALTRATAGDNADFIAALPAGCPDLFAVGPLAAMSLGLHTNRLGPNGVPSDAPIVAAAHDITGIATAIRFALC